MVIITVIITLFVCITCVIIAPEDILGFFFFFFIIQRGNSQRLQDEVFHTFTLKGLSYRPGAQSAQTGRTKPVYIDTCAENEADCA